MQFEEAVARLANLPSGLPPPTEALRPTRLATGPWQPLPDPGDRGRAAAVLVLVVPGPGGAAHVVLTQRVDRGGHHSGEVSFPGGVAEPEDRDAVDTALREAAEEVGLDPDQARLRIVGTLDTFHINVSGFTVTPVLAIAEQRPRLAANPDEVQRIIEASLDVFRRDAPIETHEREKGGWTVRFGAYRVEDLVVWGATARVLSQLGALLDD